MCGFTLEKKLDRLLHLIVTKSFSIHSTLPHKSWSHSDTFMIWISGFGRVLIKPKRLHAHNNVPYICPINLRHRGNYHLVKQPSKMKKTELEPHFIAIARHQYVEYLQTADVYPYEMRQGVSDIVLTVLYDCPCETNSCSKTKSSSIV